MIYCDKIIFETFICVSRYMDMNDYLAILFSCHWLDEALHLRQIVS